jgi:two-component system OmpR family response regulator
MRTRNYELVVADLLSARADNADFLRTLREKKPRNTLPIVVVSAVDGIDIRYEMIRAGANDYFLAPLRGTELERFLRVSFNLILER